MLPSFIRLLEENGLVDVESIPYEDQVGFVNRLKIQKYVYLAKSFGLDLGYHYSIYKYGPYSPSLAEDYYGIAENYDDIDFDEPLPSAFKVNDFLNLVSNKDPNWLEIATTLIDQRRRFADEHNLVNHVEAIKCDYSIAYIRNVLSDLKRAGLDS